MVLIDGARHGFLEPLFAQHEIGVAAAAAREVRYWKDQAGVKHPIDLTPHVAAGRLTVMWATSTEVAQLLAKKLSPGLGEGEVESLALVVARRYRFCTADWLAVKTMKALTVLPRWVPLEDLLSSLDPPVPVPGPKYLRAAAEPK